jgi:hypothetical protein
MEPCCQSWVVCGIETLNIGTHIEPGTLDYFHLHFASLKCEKASLAYTRKNSLKYRADMVGVNWPFGMQRCMAWGHGTKLSRPMAV